MNIIKNTLKRYYLMYKNKANKEKVMTALSKFSSNKIVNNYNYNKKILFVLPEYDASSGGINSLLKLGDRLYNYGYEVFFTVPNALNIEEDKRICDQNYKTTHIELIKYSEALQIKWQFVISTFFMTFYDSIQFDGYHILFLQDFESDFFEKGDLTYLFSKAIYNVPKIITLGDWIKKKILNEYGQNLDEKIFSIPFPVDLSYSNFNYKPVNNNIINLCIYNRYTGRRLPYVAEWISIQLKEELKKRGYSLNIFSFGNKCSKKIDGIIDLGILNSTQIKELYSKCQFGIAFSATNVSLVPFEMMESNVKVISLRNDSFNAFCDDTLFFDEDFSKLADDIIEWISLDSNMIESKWNDFNTKSKQSSWDNVCKCFVNQIEKN